MGIAEITEKIKPVLKKYGIKKASIFGSFSRGEERSDSDVDLLVELGPDPMGIYKYIELRDNLAEKLGRKVDLVSEGYVDQFIEPYIRPELKTIYES